MGAGWGERVLLKSAGAEVRLVELWRGSDGWDAMDGLAEASVESEQ